MPKLALAAATALLLVATSPTFAENGGEAQCSGCSGTDRNGNVRGGNYLSREVAPGIYERTRIPDRFTPRGESGVRGVAARNEAERAKGGLAARQ